MSNVPMALMEFVEGEHLSTQGVKGGFFNSIESIRSRDLGDDLVPRVPDDTLSVLESDRIPGLVDLADRDKGAAHVRSVEDVAETDFGGRWTVRCVNDHISFTNRRERLLISGTDRLRGN